ncbi:MAG: hypothetical protein JWL76_1897 [Thermoleophilia bacterium]|nr:hypothetical protein [Thermoleophilia bacterium]
MIDARLVRPWIAPFALALVPTLLALRFGGYHPRHAGWAILLLCAWACVELTRGRFSALRSVGGVASVTMVVLALWTTASIAWVDVSRHDAWTEAMRATGYAAAFLLGGVVLASARSYARFAMLTGVGIALVGLASLARMLGDAPLEGFVAGRLDWPIGYAPGMAGMSLFAMFLLLGVSVASEQRWLARRHALDLAASGLALGGAGMCAAIALLAQSRGTVPAVLVGIVVALVATPRRSTWLLRLGAIVLALVAVLHKLTAPFQTQFDLRQAPFTEGADAGALLRGAESAAHGAALATVLVAVALVAIGAALVPLGGWVTHRVGELEARAGVALAVPLAIVVVAIVATTLLVGGGRTWISDQWDGCVHPPERVNDPGSGTSYFANAGTGRCDYYSVALRSVPKHPLLGLGAGNFRGEYVRERSTAEEPRVVHSLPLQLLAELGIVGAALGVAVLSCVVLAARRFVRSGPSRDATFAGAIGALGYWTAHASIDWLWQLPATSLPALALAGGLVACVSAQQRQIRASTAAPFAAAALLVCVALVLPVAMADSALRRARDPKLQESNRAAAITAARDAQSYDPTWADPAITEGTLQFAAGRRDLAADAGRRAVRLEPRSWSVQYRASGLIGLDDTAEGLAAFQAARRLNPQLPADVTEDDDAEQDSGTDPDALQNPDT